MIKYLIFLLTILCYISCQNENPKGSKLEITIDNVKLDKNNILEFELLLKNLDRHKILLNVSKNVQPSKYFNSYPYRNTIDSYINIDIKNGNLNDDIFLIYSIPKIANSNAQDKTIEITKNSYIIVNPNATHTIKINYCKDVVHRNVEDFKDRPKWMHKQGNYKIHIKYHMNSDLIKNVFHKNLLDSLKNEDIFIYNGDIIIEKDINFLKNELN